MQSHFGIKDGVIMILLIVGIVMSGMAMCQFDRQWRQVQEINSRIREQDQAQARMEKSLKQLLKRQPQLIVQAGTPTTRQTANSQTGNTTAAGQFDTPKGNPFDRIYTARQIPEYRTGDWFVDVFGAKVAKISPYMSTDAYGSEIIDQVVETLATRDPVTLEWKPLLAKDWTISQDGMTITFTMRNNATFSDGTPVTADDVVFSFQFVMDKRIEAPRARSYFSKIKQVEKTADNQVTFTFSEPYFESFELAATMMVLPKHFYSKYTPEQYNKSVGLLMGSGPYRMPTADQWQTGEQIVLYRNPRYWGPPAPFDRIVYREIANDTARQTAFGNGDIDILGATAQQYIKMNKDPRILDIANPFEFLSRSTGYMYIAWNQQWDGKPSPFADPRVREAMTYLTPRQKICDEIFLGFAEVTIGPFHPKSKQRNPELVARDYDKAKAMKLLAEAGYKFDERRRLLIGPDGRPLRFKLTYPQASETYKKIMPILRQSYARAGITMDADGTEWAVFGQRLKTRDFQAITLLWTGGIETDIYQMFHSSQMADGGDNFMHYKNPELDKAIVDARRCMDEKKRMKLWRQCHRYLYEDQPYTFILVRRSTLFLNKRFHNVQKLEMGLNPRLEWFVPGPMQKYTAD